MTGALLPSRFLIPNRNVQQLVSDYMEYLASGEPVGEYNELLDTIIASKKKQAKELRKANEELNQRKAEQSRAYRGLILECKRLEHEEAKLKKQLAAKEDALDKCIAESVSRKDLTSARLCYREGRLDEALAFAKSAVAADPSSTEAYTVYGDILLARKEYAAAIVAFESALKHNPKNYESLGDLGLVYREMGELAEALHYFDVALEIKKDSTLLNNRGCTLAKMNKVNEALSCFDEAITEDESNLSAYRNKALILSAIGRPANALSTLRKALDINPKDEHTRRAIKTLQASLKAK